MADGAVLRTIGPMAPLRQAAVRLAGLTGWRRQLAAVLLGALAAAALPPVDLTPVLLLSFGGLVWLEEGSTDGRAAFLLGWSFGLGFFLAGLYWIAAALFVDIAQFWWLVPFAVLGLPVALGVFTGAALWASFVLARRWRLGGTARILLLAASWTVAEWLRGHVLGGFPWNLIGYAWSGAFPGGLAVLQSTSLIGIYGLSLLTVLAAALPARLGALDGARSLPTLAAALLVALLLGGGAWRLAGDGERMVPGVTLRLVQPSIPQELKNSRTALAANFRRMLTLSREGRRDQVSDIVWPEASTPPFLERFADERAVIGAVAPPGGLVIAGMVRGMPLSGLLDKVWNSVGAIDGNGDIVGVYDKFRLVPFGEFVPLRSLLPINKITPGTMDFSAGPGPTTLSLPGLPPVAPLDCYEVIFPGEVTNPAARPAWLLNLSNTAWFGKTSGPYQHLAMSRVRAVEEGLPIVRVGNNGVSGVFDPYGRMLARLDLDVVGVLDVALPEPLPPTLYSGQKDRLVGAMLVLLVAAAWASGRRRKGRESS
jgi:apolipoprotein N-acyltransferase